MERELAWIYFTLLYTTIWFGQVHVPQQKYPSIEAMKCKEKDQEEKDLEFVGLFNPAMESACLSRCLAAMLHSFAPPFVSLECCDRVQDILEQCNRGETKMNKGKMQKRFFVSYEMKAWLLLRSLLIVPQPFTK